VKIPAQKKLRILGFILDSLLSYEDHVLNVKRTCFAVLNALGMMRPLISRNSMIVLIKAMIFPHLNYTSSVWGSATCDVTKHFNTVIKAAGRLVLCKKRRDPIYELINDELGWLMADKMAKVSILCCMHRVFYNENSPEFFNNYFLTNENVHTHNTRNAKNIHVTSINKMSTKRSFKWRGAELWNSCMFKHVSNFVSFKKMILRNV